MCQKKKYCNTFKTLCTFKTQAQRGQLEKCRGHCLTLETILQAEYMGKGFWTNSADLLIGGTIY